MRLKMQLQTTTVLVLLIVCGSVAAASEMPGWAIVLATAVVAGVGSAAADFLRWAPSGCLFFVFAFAVSAAASPGNMKISLIALTAGGSAAITLLVTLAGGAIGAARRRSGTFSPHSAGHASLPRLPLPVISVHASVCFIAAAAAGMLSLGAGLAHPYWAMVSAIVPVAGSSTAGQLTRAVHRLVGTFLGLGVTALILLPSPDVAVLIVVLAFLTAGTELMVARNYGLAMLCLTPLTIGMMFLNDPQPLGPLLADRALETCVGLAVVNVLIVLTHPVRHPDERAENPG
ncbi:FUSC family protein [Pseudarthrobacter sp. fls2-241-R2A-168]|uniref:FUSC family protein n=1 Tax=Pseudarthrobacter sp. fls2-241-R2A-168 TaxID=3040304 RepID=UPI002553F3BA|nr:FUSC family protein [Pseudarthrobacter sp. fls2-241-R2A-168]